MDIETKAKILKMVSEKRTREYMRKSLNISKNKLYIYLRQLIDEGYDLHVKRKEMAYVPRNIGDDIMLNHISNFQLDEKQTLTLEENKNMKRSQLAKLLKIPKIVLNFILEKRV